MVRLWAGLDHAQEPLLFMVNRNLLRQFDRDDDVELAEIFGNDPDALATWLPADEQNYQSNKIVQGKVLEIRGDMVVIDIGYKSPGWT